MTTHQKSKACRRAALLAATGGEKKTNLRPASGSGPESDHAVEIGDVLVPPDESVDEAVNIYSLSHATAEKGVPLPEHDRSERSFFKRASDRLEVVGRRMAVTEETWRDVIMLDEFDVPVTSIAENADSGAESDESDEEQVDTAGQAVVKSLLEVMAPGDGGSGLAAGQRKKVFEFADACLAHGGSGHTIADILRSANPVRGGGKRSNNADHLLETYLDSICNGDGWTERTFRAVTGHWVTTRWNSDIIQDIVELVQDPVLFPRMRLRPQYDAKRFSHPATGLHMRAFHSLVRKQRTIAGDWDESTDVVLLLVFFSDATLLANKGSLSAHPVVLSLGNLPPLLAQRSQLMLGLLADFEKTKTDNQGQADRILSEAEQAQVRRALMAMQTAAMVEPLVQASYEGVSFISPVDGKKMRFFPTLFCAPLDHPEICSHLGVKHGYCGICKWKAEGMWDSEQSKAPFRTETDSTEFVAMVTKAPSRNIDALRKVQGAHGQRSGLWGFNGSAPLNRIPVTLTERTAKAVKEAGSSSPWTDIHLAVAGETMHEIDLGILKYAQAAVLYHLRETRGKTDQEIERINDGLRLSMTHESRWQGLDYPPTKKITGMIQGYFGGSSRVEADEHRSVLQFLVLILTRFLGMDDPATRLMARLISYYRARQVRPDEPLPGYRVHTESSLEEVDVLFDQIRTALDEVGPPVKSTEDTPKMHQQLHYRLQVMRLGTTSITTGQAGEANNARIKRPIKTGRTNNQKTAVLRTIVKLYRRSRAVRSFSKDVQREGRTCRLPARTKRYRTSELIAVQRDLCVYPNQRYIGGNLRFTILDIHNWTRSHVGSSFRPRQMASRDVTTDLRRDLFDILPVDSLKDQDTPLNRRLEFILGDWTIGRAFVSELSFFLTGEDSNTTVSKGFNLTIKIVQSAANPSVYTKSSRLDTDVRLVQKVRAAPNYRKTDKVWYDFVTLSAAEPEKGDDVWYARVILLFYIRDPKKAGKWQQLAFVRYLTRQETRQDELRRRKRPGEPQVTPFIYARRQRRTKLVWYYGVCSSESILRVVHIVAGNDEGSHSLRFSRGDRQFFEVDRKAKFLLNYNVFESAKEPYYRPTILDREQDDSSSDGEEPDSD